MSSCSTYSRLPGLRGDVEWNLGYTPTVQITVDPVAFQPTLLSPSATLRVSATVRNTGTATVITQGPGPGFVYEEGDTYVGRGYPGVPGAFRVGVDFGDNRTGVDHPYRWGLPDALQPGESASIVGYVRPKTRQRQEYWAGLVEEGVKWGQDRVGITAVASVDTPYKVFFPKVLNGGTEP
ncbi:MAG: hypothetical protein M1343_10220 [Chloroflexi bacterium]|nr:hypothetical protein [Chloroflexota bacterium]